MIEATYDFKNRDWYFRPLQRAVRGRFRLDRVNEPMAMARRDQIPLDVPGQVIGVDPEKGVGYVREPIHDDPDLKARIEKRGQYLDPERDEFPGIDVDAWLYWIRAAVDAGKVRVLKGDLPETVEYDPPNQLLPPPKRGEARKREIFRDNPQLALEYQKMTKQQREEWEKMVGV